jgi:hypothetical protein
VELLPHQPRAPGRPPWKGQSGKSEGNFFAALIQHLELQPIYTLPPRSLQPYTHATTAEGKKAAAPSPNAFISFSLSTFRTMSGCIQIPYQKGGREIWSVPEQKLPRFVEFWLKMKPDLLRGNKEHTNL